MINKEHSIFLGHFPGQPVVPGVCMLQMVKEIIEGSLNVNTNITESEQVKYLALIDPTVENKGTADIKFTKEENKLLVTASLKQEDQFRMKCRLTFVVVNKAG